MTTLNTFRNVEMKKFARAILCGMMIIFSGSNLLADCPESVGCNDNVQISLDYDCYAVIHPFLILEDEMEDCDYMVTILDLNDKVIATTQVHPITGDLIYPSIDGSFVGSVWKASISFVDSYGITLSCWGYFTVEDKLPPSITCIEDFTVECSEDLSELYSSESEMIFCSEINPVDVDLVAGTQTICLTTIDEPKPWEIIENVMISGPVTGSGTGLLNAATGSGSMQLAMDSYLFTIDPVTGQINASELIGVQTTEDNIPNKMFLTVPISNDLSDGICIKISSSSFFKYQTFDNCDPSTEVIVTRDEIEDLQCNESNLYTARRDIEYFTRDNAGLSAQPCDFSIYFEKKTLDALEFPENIVFSCMDPDIFDEDGELDLGPHVTGYPTLDGDPLTEQNNLCRINVTFTDDTFNICGVNTMKILRKWTALDWCEGEYQQAWQTIKVEDADAPSIICPDGLPTFEADGDCTADIIFKPLDSSDTTGVEQLLECSSFSVSVRYYDEYGVYQSAQHIGSNMFRILNLGYGYHTITYVFTDECGNTIDCEFDIRFVDDAAPIPVCDQFTAVVLADNGWARAYTETFDDGSYDDCGGPVSFQVRRPDLHCFPYDSIFDHYGQLLGVQDTLFNDYVEFCCDDAGKTVDVILKVTDAGGRYNTCLVKVEVQDKTPFTIVSCPQREWDLDCSESIDTTVLGFPVIEDNCAVSSLYHVDTGDIDESCGQGDITRRWYVEVNGSTQELVSCRQYISISNKNRLTHFDFLWPDPERTDATCSNYHTDLGDTIRIKSTGIPVTEADLCGILAYSYKDKVFYNVEGLCLKIIRTWTVVDWCIYDPNGEGIDGIWSETQVIKVFNSAGPDLSNCSQDTIFRVTDNTCAANIFLQAPDAYDACFDESIAPNRIKYELRNRSVDTLVKVGLGNLIATNLPVGEYEVIWSAAGACSVYSYCSSDIDVVDGKSPSPYCKSGITTVLMQPGANGEEPYVEIWASYFDLNSTDNCSGDLIFSFDPDVHVPNMTFNCEQLGLQSLNVWVIDESGNKDFCHTSINIQANGTICPPDTMGLPMMIAGYISTEYDDMIEQVEVSLQSKTNAQMSYRATDVDGHFAFENMTAHEDYIVRASNDVDYLNGVSTLDLILIQRHILGIEALDSPYKLIAADVNSNEEISAIDLIELRKLILGIYDDLPENESWRFVDRSQIFPDIYAPWPFNEEIDIYDLSTDEMTNNFIAVKIGDVNGSAEINNAGENSQIISRSNEDFKLLYDILEISEHSEYLIPFYMDQNASIFGMQTAVSFNSKDIEIVGLESGKLDLSVVNYNMRGEDILISWNDNSPIDVKADEALFYLTVRTDQQVNVGAFDLTASHMKSEIYTSDFKIHDLDLTGNSSDVDNRLYQNVPNPFSSETDIIFDLENEMEVKINILDGSGKLLRSYVNIFPKGENRYTVSSHDLNGNGVYYFNIETEAFSATKKMILIE